LAQCNTELFQTDEVDSGDCRDVDDEALTGDGEIERSRVVGKLGEAVENLGSPSGMEIFSTEIGVVLGAIALKGMRRASVSTVRLS
jgi:hypothetical protein